MDVISMTPSCGTIATAGTIHGMTPGMVSMAHTIVTAIIAGTIGDGVGTIVQDGFGAGAGDLPFIIRIILLTMVINLATDKVGDTDSEPAVTIL